MHHRCPAAGTDEGEEPSPRHCLRDPGSHPVRDAKLEHAPLEAIKSKQNWLRDEEEDPPDLVEGPAG